MTEHDALALLLGGYLHQDWDVDYPSVWVAVDDFLSSEGHNTAVQARREVEAVLAEGSDEDEIRQLLDRLCCSYWPPGEGLSFRDWLEQLRDHLPLADPT